MSSGLDTTASRPFNRPCDEPFQHPTGNIHAHGLAQYSPQSAEAFSIPIPATVTKHDIPPLFEISQLPLAPICPQRWPGIDAESTKMLLKVLEDNHCRWHIFFNYKGFHNHSSHHLVAIWAMGASADIIIAAYETHCEYQRPAFDSPSNITRHNFNEHLGDERFYSAYMDFFTCELGKKGFARTLGEYIFAPSANYLAEPRPEKNGDPEMLARFLAGFLHPLIQTGYGAEFGLLGLSAEGLAMTAVHSPQGHGLLSPSYFDSPMKPGNLHALSVLALVAKDERFGHIKRMEETDLWTFVTSLGETLRAYAEMWAFDVADKEDIAKAVEELAWLNAIIYGVGGMSGKGDNEKAFNADFFLMHLVTSSIFLPSLLTSLYQNSRAQALLLRSYFAASLALYVGRGRPNIDIAKFYSDTSLFLPSSGRDVVPGPQPSPVKHTLPDRESAEARTPNPWLSIVQTTLVHPNEHLCKAQRSLAHFSSLYGLRGQGWFTSLRGQQANLGTDDKLEDAERSLGLGELDGTLFLRVAMLTANRLGWMREGESEEGWDTEGFFEK